jgi:hypothetical protein
MKRPLLVAALAALCWLVFGAHAPSWAVQQPARAEAEQRALHDKLRVLRPGSEITVFTADGLKIVGTLREVQADAIVIDHKKGGGSSTVLVADIERIQTRSKGRHAVTQVLVIVGATLGALFVIGVATC